MKEVLVACFISMVTSWTIDFTDNESIQDWVVVNDGVMGGRSKGFMTPGEAGLLFYGKVSLENNGGFTSVRCPYQPMNLSDFDVVELKYRSVGVRQVFQLEVDRRFYVPNYKIPLADSEDWEIVRIPLREVRQYRLGTKTGKLLDKNACAEVIRLGFITDEKRAGDFTFEVAYIKFE